MSGDPYILVVGTEPGALPLSDDVREELCAKVHRCPDVFRTLARIGHDSSIRGVIVDVCSVNLGHMEFFSLAGRVRPGLAVYVTAGLDTMTQRVGDAIDFGATGKLTDSAAGALMAGCRAGGKENDETTDKSVASANGEPPSATATEKHPTVQQVDVSHIASSGEANDPIIADQQVDPADEAETLQEPEDGLAAEPARVPWLRYTDVPGRKRPSATRESPTRRPPTGGQSGAGGPGQRHDEHEPLLTNEELAALLGDDGSGDSHNDPMSDVEDNEGETGAIR